MSELTDTLRSEARYRPTIWGDGRPLLIEAANEIDRLREFYDAHAALEASYNRFTGWDRSKDETSTGVAASQLRLHNARAAIEMASHTKIAERVQAKQW